MSGAQEALRLSIASLDRQLDGSLAEDLGRLQTASEVLQQPVPVADPELPALVSELLRRPGQQLFCSSRRWRLDLLAGLPYPPVQVEQLRAGTVLPLPPVILGPPESAELLRL